MYVCKHNEYICMNDEYECLNFELKTRGEERERMRQAKQKKDR